MEQNEIVVAQDTQPPAFFGEPTSTNALVLDGDSMDKLVRTAELMATSKVTIPKHLQGSSGDCLAVVMQSVQWGMNPFAVAQKTHLVNGTLGYEAQLVNAVVQSSGAIEGRFHYEYRGEGSALECRAGAVPRGEKEIVWTEWLKSIDVTTKNSPLWKTNPKQQFGYLQVKNWARAYAPGAILGVYTPDELESGGITDINSRPARVNGTEAAQAAVAQPAATPERDKIIADLERVAKEQGIDRYAEQWKALTKQQRQLVGTAEHERLKQLAETGLVTEEGTITEVAEGGRNYE